jgi:hypothetical protein
VSHNICLYILSELDPEQRFSIADEKTNDDGSKQRKEPTHEKKEGMKTGLQDNSLA